MEKSTFTLTAADIALLNTVQDMAESIFANPAASRDHKERMNAIWQVLGEKHDFVWTSAEKHPDGEPKILALPVGKETETAPGFCIFCSSLLTAGKMICPECGIYQDEDLDVEPIKDRYQSRELSEATDHFRGKLYFRNMDGKFMAANPAVFNQGKTLAVFGLATNDLQVLRSAAGYYIGTLSEEDFNGPVWTPKSGQSETYYQTYEVAAEALRTSSYPVKL